MSEFDEQEKRIKEILGSGYEEVTEESLKTYLEYLKENIEKPCLLTGMEDFPWEERYVFGYGDKREYEELKKTNPSYTDEFELIDFEDEVSEGSGIFVKVKRTSDKKHFSLELSYLEAVDKKSKNYTILDDYSVWFVNFR